MMRGKPKNIGLFRKTITKAKNAFGRKASQLKKQFRLPPEESRSFSVGSLFNGTAVKYGWRDKIGKIQMSGNFIFPAASENEAVSREARATVRNDRDLKMGIHTVVIINKSSKDLSFREIKQRVEWDFDYFLGKDKSGQYFVILTDN